MWPDMKRVTLTLPDATLKLRTLPHRERTGTERVAGFVTYCFTRTWLLVGRLISKIPSKVSKG
jgi:hypothetical protein